MNKIVVISGASSGIGSALKKRFLADGNTVIGLSRSGADGDDIVCDVTDESSIDRAVSEIAQRFGRVDILINNAGIGISGATELIPMADIRQAMEVSYFGALSLTRHCLKHMTRGARIIFVSSISGLTAIPFRSVYCSAKAAELMLGSSLRMELSHTGISVLTLCPGEIKTSFSANKLADTTTSERYGSRVERALDKVAKREEKRMKLDRVIGKIYKICLRGKKAMYVIGGKYRFLYLLQRLLPTTLYQNMTNKMLGGK